MDCISALMRRNRQKKSPDSEEVTPKSTKSAKSVKLEDKNISKKKTSIPPVCEGRFHGVTQHHTVLHSTTRCYSVWMNAGV